MSYAGGIAQGLQASGVMQNLPRKVDEYYQKKHDNAYSQEMAAAMQGEDLDYQGLAQISSRYGKPVLALQLGLLGHNALQKQKLQDIKNEQWNKDHELRVAQNDRRQEAFNIAKKELDRKQAKTRLLAALNAAKGGNVGALAAVYNELKNDLGLEGIPDIDAARILPGGVYEFRYDGPIDESGNNTVGFNSFDTMMEATMSVVDPERWQALQDAIAKREQAINDELKKHEGIKKIDQKYADPTRGGMWMQLPDGTLVFVTPRDSGKVRGGVPVVRAGAGGKGADGKGRAPSAANYNAVKQATDTGMELYKLYIALGKPIPKELLAMWNEQRAAAGQPPVSNTDVADPGFWNPEGTRPGIAFGGADPAALLQKYLNILYSQQGATGPARGFDTRTTVPGRPSGAQQGIGLGLKSAHGR